MILEDLSTMPFGKCGPQGERRKMQDVPDSYLHWLWTQGLKNDKANPVADYIRRNLDSLKEEHPDGIWD